MESKAVVFEKVGKYSTDNIKVPAVEDGTMLLKIELAGVCGTDLHILKGHFPNTPFPIIPGHEIVGIVEKIGKDCDKKMNLIGEIDVGDRVTVAPGVVCGECYYCRWYPHRGNFCTSRKAYGISRSSAEYPYLVGGMSEYIYLTPGSWVYNINDLTPELGVLIEPMSVGVKAVEFAMRPGMPLDGAGLGLADVVLIQGAGTIGLMTLVASKMAGAGKTIIIDMDKSRLKVAKMLGADLTIDMNDYQTGTDRVEKVFEYTDGIGADVVLECAGVLEAFQEALDYARKGGKVIELGMFTDAGSIPINPFTICSKELEVIGSFGYPAHNFKRAIEVVRQRRFPIEELVSESFSIDEFGDALRSFRERRGIDLVIEP